MCRFFDWKIYCKTIRFFGKKAKYCLIICVVVGCEIQWMLAHLGLPDYSVL